MRSKLEAEGVLARLREHPAWAEEHMMTLLRSYDHSAVERPIENGAGLQWTGWCPVHLDVLILLLIIGEPLARRAPMQVGGFYKT